MTHDELCARAEKWLINNGCGVTLKDPFKSYTANGEQPDAIGWRDGLSIMVECKVSRSDFLADKKKKFRNGEELGMGDWRFYLSPPEIIRPDDLPEGWGLLWAKPKTIHKVSGVPGNCGWWHNRPFEPCKRSETMMLYSALRRLSLRGYLPEVYKGPVGNEYGQRTGGGDDA